MGNTQAQLQNQLLNLKFTAKALNRSSKKCRDSEKKQKAKLKKAIKEGNMEGAKIYASNAIREKNQSLSFLRLSSRVDAVASRVETAVRIGELNKSMGSVVKGMDTVLHSMDPAKISQLMGKFEQHFDSLDLNVAVMDEAMDQSTAGII